MLRMIRNIRVIINRIRNDHLVKNGRVRSNSVGCDRLDRIVLDIIRLEMINLDRVENDLVRFVQI